MVKKEDLKKQAFERAKEVIRLCSTKNGLFASGGRGGYNSVWARDSMIAGIGLSILPEFESVFRQSLVTLAKNQSKEGEIPNCVDKFLTRKPHIDYKSIDSSLWYIIGHFTYKKKFNTKLFKKYNQSIKKAFNWLKYQGSVDSGMLKQLPTTDWQDAFPHKYGYTINTQALYYKVLNLFKRYKEAKKLKFFVNKDQEHKLWLNNFYLAYRWKNHNKYKEIGDWFDSLGNLLAIIFDLADDQQTKKILDYIKQKKINSPYPVKAIYPPITKKSKYWQDYYLDSEAGKPYHYANAGIWGYIGCFYILSLIKMKKFREAEIELKKLAEINLRSNFPEWTNPVTKKSYGKLQAWEAGMYILAYESFKNKKVLI